MMISTPDISDNYPDLDFLPYQFKSYGIKSSFYGQVETIKAPDDNSKIKGILATPGEGRVLIVDGGESRKVALLGDQIAANAQKNEWVGIIIIGYVRDVEILNSIDIGIFALGAVPKKSAKLDRGLIGEALILSGIHVKQGDWVYCDKNGVIISEQEIKLVIASDTKQ